MSTLVVHLDESLDRSRRVGIWHAIKLIPGVQSIARLDAISRETLDVMLRPPTIGTRRARSPFNAIRRHYRRKLQPELLPEARG